MSDKVVFDPEKITLIEFKIIKGQVDTPEEFSIEKVSGHHIENKLLLSFNMEENLARTDFSIEVKTDSKGANAAEAVGNFSFVYIFRVDNLHELAKQNTEKHTIDVNPDLAFTLASIAYSTSRGVLLTRFQGTALQTFVLPVVSVHKLLQ